MTEGIGHARIIDTHVHLWELERGWLSWNTPDLGTLHTDAELAQIGGDLTTLGVGSVIVVQAADTLAETHWLLETAAADPRIAGVVGYLPLDSPARLSAILEATENLPLVGVRQLWHNHRPSRLDRRGTVASLRMLGEIGMAVDVPNAFPHLTGPLMSAATAAPRTTFVLDHCAKPPFGDADAWPVWRERLTRLAELPNLVVKVSGLFEHETDAPVPTAAELDDLMELVGSQFGADRVLVGSDWPICRERGYGATMSTYLQLLAQWPGLARATRDNARTTYPRLREPRNERGLPPPQ